LKINKEVLDKIKYLCKEIPKVEWSGVLFYRVKGTITKPDSFSVYITDVLPMHKGTAAYTEYEFSQDVADYIEEDNERFEWKIGHIHSHNTMKTYFSGTDMSELNDNSEFHTYYLSLIVNNFMDLTAKIAYRANTEGFSYSATDEFGNKFIKNIKKPEQLLMIHDCDIEIPENEIEVSFDFAKRVEEIIAKDKEKSNFKVVAPDWNQAIEDTFDFDLTTKPKSRKNEIEDSIEIFVQTLMEKCVTEKFLSTLPEYYDWLHIIDHLEMSEDKLFNKFSKKFIGNFEQSFNQFYSGGVDLESTEGRFIIKEIVTELKFSDDQRMKVIINFLKQL
jgi:proteasome lid subunit RPN8/RPN11